jgi:hypothetical protein
MKSRFKKKQTVHAVQDTVGDNYGAKMTNALQRRKRSRRIIRKKKV